MSRKRPHGIEAVCFLAIAVGHAVDTMSEYSQACQASVVRTIRSARKSDVLAAAAALELVMAPRVRGALGAI